jgi:hypothetical protein
MATTIFDSLTIISASESPFTMSLFGINSSSLGGALLYHSGSIAFTGSGGILPQYSGQTPNALTYFTDTSIVASADNIIKQDTDNYISVDSNSNFLLDGSRTYAGGSEALTQVAVFIGTGIHDGGTGVARIEYIGDITTNFSSRRYYVYLNDEFDDNVWGDTIATTHGSSITYDGGLDITTIILTASAQPYPLSSTTVINFFFIDASGGNDIIPGTDSSKYAACFGSFAQNIAGATSIPAAGALGKYTTTIGGKNVALGPYTHIEGSGNISTNVASFVAGTNNESIGGRDGQFICGIGGLAKNRVTGSLFFEKEKFIVNQGGIEDFGDGNNNRFHNFEVVTHSNTSASMIVPYTFNNQVTDYISNPKTGSMFFHAKASRLRIYNGTAWVSLIFD